MDLATKLDLVATKQDLTAEFAELKAELIKWYVITTFGLAGTVSVVVGLLVGAE